MSCTTPLFGIIFDSRRQRATRSRSAASCASALREAHAYAAAGAMAQNA